MSKPKPLLPRRPLVALRRVNPIKAWRERRYCKFKAALDAPFLRARRRTVGAGVLQGVQIQPSGADLAFAEVALQIRFLAPEVLRLRWEPSGETPPYAFASETLPWKTPDVAAIEAQGVWKLRTHALIVEISPEGIAYRSPDGKVVRREGWALRQGDGWRHTVWLPPSATVQGLGAQATAANLRGGRYLLWNRFPRDFLPTGEASPLALPVIWAIGAAGAHLTFYNNPARGEITIGDEMSIAFSEGALEYFLIFGEPEEIARRFAELTGFPPMPPRWTFAGEGRQILRVAPAVRVGTQKHREGRAAGAFCRLPNGDEVVAPTSRGLAAFPDFTSPSARAWWGALLGEEIGDAAGLSLDENEPTLPVNCPDPTLPLPTAHDLEGLTGDHRLAHNLYGQQMARAAHEALQRLRPQNRPFVLSRAGWVGLQRYAWAQFPLPARRQAIKAAVGAALGLGLAGVPFFGARLHAAERPSPELYARLLSLAALLPFFSGAEAALENEFAAAVEQHLTLRRRLLPYFYTLAWEAHTTGVPPIRPLWWEAPRDADLRRVDDAFMLGNALLVAPAPEGGARERFLHLPWGAWYDFWSGAPIQAEHEAVLDAPLDRTPILARGGALIPLEDGDALTLWLGYPTERRTTSRFYFDSGDGQGDYRLENWLVRREPPWLVLTRTVEGDYPFPYKLLRLELHGAQAAEVYADGARIAPEDGAFPLPLTAATIRILPKP